MNNNKYTKVGYRQDGNAFYKINYDLKRITRLENNQPTFLEFDEHKEVVESYKKIRMEIWRNKENRFFISRVFQWEYQGKIYHSTDKKITWNDGNYGGHEALVFHNGKIWTATYSANYYPRIYLCRKKYDGTEDSKWTNIKYCRHFEIVPRISKIKKFLAEDNEV